MERFASGLVEPFTSGAAFTEVVAGTTPVAGANFAYTEESGFYSRLLAVTFQLVTSATVANRSVHVDYDDGNGLIFGRFGSGAVQQAGTTGRYSFDSERGAADWDSNNFLYVPLRAAWIYPAQLVRIVVLNIDGTDQLSAVVLHFERYRSGPYPREAG